MIAREPAASGLRWVFLDLGNVLWDEDPLGFFSFARHVEAVRAVRPDLAFGDLLAEGEARAAAGSRWPVYDVVSSYLSEARCSEVWEETSRAARHRFDELSPPIPGAIEAVHRLRSRYRLGLIANQPRESRARLERLGWLGSFDVVALAEEIGSYKPDPAIFRAAIDLAGALPEACLMVGDRIDDDLAPASALGMATAWVSWPRRAAKGWEPDDPDALAYLRSLDRLARKHAGPAGFRPDHVVGETRELPEMVESLGRGPVPGAFVS